MCLCLSHRHTAQTGGTIGCPQRPLSFMHRGEPASKVCHDVGTRTHGHVHTTIHTRTHAHTHKHPHPHPRTHTNDPHNIFHTTTHTRTNTHTHTRAHTHTHVIRYFNRHTNTNIYPQQIHGGVFINQSPNGTD